MATVLQWRRFNFFDVKSGIDDGKISEALQDAKISSIDAGRGVIYIGDSNGSLHCVGRTFHITSFPAHDTQINLIKAIDHTSRVITCAVSGDGIPEVKVWSPDRQTQQGHPACLRIIRPDPRSSQALQRGHPPPSLTALAIHSSMTLMVLGFSDGAIMIFRGEISRERSSKSRVLLTVSSGSITSLNIKEGTKTIHLFATTKNKLYCINCSVRDKESTIELDPIGCENNCATLALFKQDQNFLMARSDAIYSYTNDSRASCYVFEGEKVYLSWYKGHLIVIARDKTPDGFRDEGLSLTVFDPINKLVALSTYIRGFVGVVGEWGGLYVVTPDATMIHISEKDLQSKLDVLFRKNQFDIAISLAKMQRCDREEVSEILRQYGDWLYGKGNLGSAMDQYIKTIPHLEPSYVIKKYLDTQHINHLTTYLQALHKEGAAMADHTSLMLNCYTRLRDTQQLDDFITSQGGALDCDVELGVRVCRGAGYFDHALALAAKHGLHHHHIAILIDDKKDYVSALRYISTLDFYSAKENILRYGSVLLTQAPEDTTQLIISLCTDYKPSNKPVISGGSLDGYLTPEDVEFGNPEDFEYLLVGHSESAIMLLEHLMKNGRKLSSRLYNTLLGEYLHQYSLGPEGQQNTYGEKAKTLLERGDNTYDKDHALLLCDKYQFHAGKVILWEHAQMYEQLMEYYFDCEDFDSVIKICTKYGDESPKLWVRALKLITSDQSYKPPDNEHLTKILEEIERHSTKQKEEGGSNSQLLSPLEVVDLLASSCHITLGQVRSFLLRVVSEHKDATASETRLSEQYSSDTGRMRDQITAITTGATEFTGTKCNICNNELELPSIHFLCHHSFHLHCFESYSQSEDSCHICLPEVNKIKQEMTDQAKKKQQQESFQEKLESSGDVFSVVADYLGSGLFTNCESLNKMYPRLNTTKETQVIPPPRISAAIKQPHVTSEARIREFETRNKNRDQVPLSEGRIRAFEKDKNTSFSGTTGEGRLRLGERTYQGNIDIKSESRIRQQERRNDSSPNTTSESRLRANFQSKVLPAQSEAKVRSSHSSNISIPSSEARLRVGDAFSQKKGPTSLLDHITPTSSLNPSPRSHSPDHSIAAALSSSIKCQVGAGVDNPFDSEDANNPFGDDFATEELEETNPFQEDFDDNNPFAGSSPSPTGSKPNTEAANPFGDEEEFDATNPFS